MIKHQYEDSDFEDDEYSLSDNQIKEFVFTIFHAALKADKTQLYQLFIIQLLGLFQVLYYLFLTPVRSIWQLGETGDDMENFFQVFQLYPYFESSSSLVFLMTFYFVIAYIFVLGGIGIYVHNKKKSGSKGIVLLFSMLLVGNMSVLYFPILGILMEVFNCENGNLHGNEDLPCWGIEHAVHFTIGIIFALLFLGMQIFTALLYVDCLHSKNASARRWSGRQLLELILRTVLFFGKYTDSQGTLVIISGGGCALVYGYLTAIAYYSRVHYSMASQRLLSIHSIVLAWCGFSLIFGYIVNTSFYSLTWATFILGAILIILALNLGMNEISIQRLLNTPIDLTKPEEIEDAINELMTLVEGKLSRATEMVLCGFLHYHESKCVNPACPISAFLVKVEHAKEVMKDDKKKEFSLNKSITALINFCTFQYCECIRKLPDSSTLRLAYSQFLVERLNNTSMAIHEIDQCNWKNLDLIDQFTTFRLRKEVHEMILNKNKNTNEAISEAAIIAYESTLKQFKRLIEKCTMYHLQFWGLLYEESPNLLKIILTGTRILKALDSIEGHYQRLEQINPNNPKVNKLYASFFHEVVNDGERCKELVSMMKEFGFTKSHFSKYQNASHKLVSNANAAGDGSPCIIVSGQLQHIGTVNSCNMSLCKLFGYSKKEIIGLNIQNLMPIMYARHHTQILNQYLEYRESIEETKHHDISVYGLHKNGYIFPITLKVLATPSYINDSSFIALFNFDKQNASTSIAYLLTNKQFEVKYASSSAISLLRIDRSMINLENLFLSDLIPSFCPSFIEACQSKAGEKVDFYFPKSSYTQFSTLPDPEAESNRANALRKNSRKLHLELVQSIYALCHIEKLHIGSHKAIGFSIRIEIVEDKSALSCLSLAREVKYPLFQFRYDEGANKYIREINNGNKALLDTGNIYSRGISIRIIDSEDSNKKSPAKHNHLEEKQFNQEEAEDEIISKMGEISSFGNSGFYATLLPKIRSLSKFISKEENAESTLIQELAEMLHKKRVDYGQKITTYRIIQGTLMEVNDDCVQPGLLSNPEQAGSFFLDDDEEGARREIAGTSVLSQIRSRDTFKLRVSEAPLPKQLKLLLILSLLAAATLITFNCLLYYFSQSYVKSTNTELYLMNQAHILTSYVHSSIFGVRDAILAKSSLSISYTQSGKTLSAYIKTLHDELEEYSHQIYTISDTISDQTNSLSNQEAAASIFESQSISLKYKVEDQLSYLSYNFPEMIIAFIAQLHSFGALEADEITENNYHSYFLLQNGFNSVIEALEKVNNIMDEALLLEKDRNKVAVDLIFALAICVAILFIPLSLFMFWQISMAEERILALFLELPTRVLKIFIEKGELFLQNLGMGRGTDVESMEEEQQLKSEITFSFLDYASRRLRKFKNKPQFIKKLAFCFAFAAMVIFCFFILSYTYSITFRNQFNAMVDELSRTLRLESVSLLALNSQRECFYGNSDLLILGEDKCSQSLSSIEEGYTISNVLDNIFIEAKMTDNSAQSEIRQILQGDLCTLDFGITVNSDIANCTTVLNGAIRQGLIIVISYYYKLLRSSLSEYMSNPSSSILTTDELFSLHVLQEQYITPFMRLLATKWLDGIDSEGNKNKAILLSTLIVFILGVCFCLFFVWRPLLNAVETSLMNIRLMLTIVPVQVLTKSKAVSHFLEHHI